MGLQIAGCGNEIWKSLFGLLPFSISHRLEKFMGEAQVHLAPGQDSESSSEQGASARPRASFPGVGWGGLFLSMHIISLSSLISLNSDILAALSRWSGS